MTFILSLLLGISIAGNIILVWYTRKLVKNLYYGVKNVDEMQKLLSEYSSLLEPLLTMENYYGDPAITSAITNTKLVVDVCKTYKKSIIESQDEEIKETEEDNSNQDKHATQTQTPA
jgi:hypothetical protein